MITKTIRTFLCTVFISCSILGIVQAQEEIPPTTLTLSLPESLAGYTLIAQDGAGTPLSETTIDATGTGQISYPVSTLELLVNTANIPESPSEEVAYSLVDLVYYCSIIAVVSALLFYYLGRRRMSKILSELRDYVHEEDLD